MKHGKIMFKGVMILLVSFFFAYGVASFSHDFLLSYEQIDGTSMEPELFDAEHVFITPVIYWFQNPSRFDIIAFEKDKNFYVKRIIGLPKEKVSINNNHIYIDDMLLPENYGKEDTLEDMEEISLSEDEYFVLGDNRVYSMDSRSEQIGVVKKEQIKGKVLFH